MFAGASWARACPGHYGERIEPASPWEDLVLAEGQQERLRELARLVRERTGGVPEREVGQPRGVTALFAGETGTGKTAAAKAIACALGAALHRVDLPAVMSKYIGETEKYLRQIFNEAEMSSAVLLFEEADALFGRRAEVADSHDRYASLELSCLELIESFRGLTILLARPCSDVPRGLQDRLDLTIDFGRADDHC
jgi:SpoVK/Ycf46/Vps4 family AAA+-type ATPase